MTKLTKNILLASGLMLSLEMLIFLILLFTVGAGIKPAGTTALHTACSRCDLNKVKSLLTHKNTPDREDEHGDTPLRRLLGVRNCPDKEEMLQVLLNHKANIEHLSRDGLRPIHSIPALNSPNVLTMLLKYGANINATDKLGNTALHKKCDDSIMGEKDATIVSILLANGADKGLKNMNGETPLDIARRCNRQDLIKYLQP